MTDKFDIGFGTQFSLNPSMGSWVISNTGRNFGSGISER